MNRPSPLAVIAVAAIIAVTAAGAIAPRAAAQRGSAQRGSAQRGSAQRGSAQRGSAPQGWAQPDSAADRAAIARFDRAFETATRTMDLAASLALWDDDGVSLTPASKALVGKPAIADFLAGVAKQITGATMQRFDMRCVDLIVSAPIATEWCVEHQVVLLADRTTFDGWGKLALVLRRGSDGRWRLKQETWLPGLPSDSVLLRAAVRE